MESPSTVRPRASLLTELQAWISASEVAISALLSFRAIAFKRPVVAIVISSLEAAKAAITAQAKIAPFAAPTTSNLIRFD